MQARASIIYLLKVVPSYLGQVTRCARLEWPQVTSPPGLRCVHWAMRWGVAITLQPTQLINIVMRTLGVSWVAVRGYRRFSAVTHCWRTPHSPALITISTDWSTSPPLLVKKLKISMLIITFGNGSDCIILKKSTEFRVRIVVIRRLWKKLAFNHLR